MIIREESASDYDKIYDLVKVAFQTAQVTNGKEQDFVNELRSGYHYIPELALVAEENGELIGHIMLTKTSISQGCEKLGALFLGPISVPLELRNKKIGTALIQKSFEVARALGFGAVLLVGNPAFYSRFGFKPAISFGIRHSHEIPDENVMAACANI